MLHICCIYLKRWWKVVPLPTQGHEHITLSHKISQIIIKSMGKSTISDIWYLCLHLLISVDICWSMVAWSELERTITGWHRVAQRRCGKNLPSCNARWWLSRLKKSTGIFDPIIPSGIPSGVNGIGRIRGQSSCSLCFVERRKLLLQVRRDLVVASKEFLVLPWPRSNYVTKTLGKCHCKQRITHTWKYLESTCQDESRRIWIASRTMAACDRLLSAPSGGALWSEDSKYLSNMRDCKWWNPTMYDILTYLWSIYDILM